MYHSMIFPIPSTDVKDIAYVINYDMPNGIEDYIHRCVCYSLSIRCPHLVILT